MSLTPLRAGWLPATTAAARRSSDTTPMRRAPASTSKGTQRGPPKWLFVALGALFCIASQTWSGGHVVGALVPHNGLPALPRSGLPALPRSGLPALPDNGLPARPDNGLPARPHNGSALPHNGPVFAMIANVNGSRAGWLQNSLLGEGSSQGLHPPRRLMQEQGLESHAEAPHLSVGKYAPQIGIAVKGDELTFLGPNFKTQSADVCWLGCQRQASCFAWTWNLKSLSCKLVGVSMDGGAAHELCVDCISGQRTLALPRQLQLQGRLVPQIQGKNNQSGCLSSRINTDWFRTCWFKGTHLSSAGHFESAAVTMDLHSVLKLPKDTEGKHFRKYKGEDLCFENVPGEAPLCVGVEGENAEPGNVEIYRGTYFFMPLFLPWNHFHLNLDSLMPLVQKVIETKGSLHDRGGTHIIIAKRPVCEGSMACVTSDSAKLLREIETRLSLFTKHPIIILEELKLPKAGAWFEELVVWDNVLRWMDSAFTHSSHHKRSRSEQILKIRHLDDPPTVNLEWGQDLDLATFVSLHAEYATMKLQDQPSVIRVGLLCRRGSRRIINTEEIKQMMEAFDSVHVELIYLEDLSSQQQISTVRALDVMIGVHGAGLTNIMYMRPKKSAVIEIFPFNVQRAPYDKLASQLGVDYVHWRNTKAENTRFDFSLTNSSASDREITLSMIDKRQLTRDVITTPNCGQFFNQLDQGGICSRVLLKQDTIVDVNEFRVAFFRIYSRLTSTINPVASEDAAYFGTWATNWRTSILTAEAYRQRTTNPPCSNIVFLDMTIRGHDSEYQKRPAMSLSECAFWCEQSTGCSAAVFVHGSEGLPGDCVLKSKVSLSEAKDLLAPVAVVGTISTVIIGTDTACSQNVDAGMCRLGVAGKWGEGSGAPPGVMGVKEGGLYLIPEPTKPAPVVLPVAKRDSGCSEHDPECVILKFLSANHQTHTATAKRKPVKRNLANRRGHVVRNLDGQADDEEEEEWQAETIGTSQQESKITFSQAQGVLCDSMFFLDVDTNTALVTGGCFPDFKEADFEAQFDGKDTVKVLVPGIDFWVRVRGSHVEGHLPGNKCSACRGDQMSRFVVHDEGGGRVRIELEEAISTPSGSSTPSGIPTSSAGMSSTPSGSPTPTEYAINLDDEY